MSGAMLTLYRNLHIDPDREAVVAEAIGSWSFSAHDLTDDELLYGSRCILEHALAVEELEPWRISTGMSLAHLILSFRADPHCQTN